MKLLIIPTPINSDYVHLQISESLRKKIYSCELFFAEKAKTARTFLKTINYPKAIQDVNIIEINRTNGISELQTLIKNKIINVAGLLSECGCPVVADPGAELIAYAHSQHITVVPLAGESSITQSLMASGFGGQNFAFHGYLPHHNNEKITALRKYLINAFIENETQIFIETPYRTESLINFLISEKNQFLKIAKNNRQLYFCVCGELQSNQELIISKALSNWTNKDALQFVGKPSVFLFNFNI